MTDANKSEDMQVDQHRDQLRSLMYVTMADDFIGRYLGLPELGEDVPVVVCHKDATPCL